MNNDLKIRVLFVCMGNICRSPTAEGVFTSVVESIKLDSVLQNKFEVDSAGTHAYHIGNPPDKRSQATAKHHGIDLSKLVARKITPKDFNDFDYIIAMDRENLLNLQSIKHHKSQEPTKASLHLFMEFADNWENDEVPDPYYGSGDGFEEVFKMIKNASEGLLNHIENTSI